MKVLLLQNVKKVGKKGDIIEVQDGFARNHLFPKKLGQEVNQKIINQKQHLERMGEIHTNKEVERIVREVKKTEGVDLVFPAKANAQGGLFAKFGESQVRDALIARNIHIGTDYLKLSDEIKHTGTYSVAVVVHGATVGMITFSLK